MPSPDGRSPAAPTAPEAAHKRRPRRAGMGETLKRWLGGEAANPAVDHTMSQVDKHDPAPTVAEHSPEGAHE